MNDDFDPRASDQGNRRRRTDRSACRRTSPSRSGASGRSPATESARTDGRVARRSRCASRGRHRETSRSRRSENDACSSPLLRELLPDRETRSTAGSSRGFTIARVLRSPRAILSWRSMSPLERPPPDAEGSPGRRRPFGMILCRDARDGRVVVVEAAAARAGPEGEHVLRVHHLLVDAAKDRRLALTDRPDDPHQVAAGGAKEAPEPRPPKRADALKRGLVERHELHPAARSDANGYAKREYLPRPAEERIQLRRRETRLGPFEGNDGYGCRRGPAPSSIVAPAPLLSSPIRGAPSSPDVNEAPRSTTASEAQHFHEGPNQPERPKLDGPRVDEDRLDVEDHEEDRGQVEQTLPWRASGAARRCSPSRTRTAASSRASGSSGREGWRRRRRATPGAWRWPR